eukprot:6830392-Pyramimonas_sp.AAC.1
MMKDLTLPLVRSGLMFIMKVYVQFSVAEVALLEPQTQCDERVLQEVRLPREKKMSALGVMIHDGWTEHYDLMGSLKKADRA